MSIPTYELSSEYDYYTNTIKLNGEIFIQLYTANRTPFINWKLLHELADNSRSQEAEIVDETNTLGIPQ